MPMSTASRKGLSSVAAAAHDQRVILTSHGRTVAVVDSPERVDEDSRRIREATLAVLDAAAELVSGRSAKLDLDEVCSRLGLDPDRVRVLAETRSAEAR